MKLLSKLKNKVMNMSGKKKEKDEKNKKNEKKMKFHPWKPFYPYVLENKVKYKGKVYECLVNHTSDRTNSPTLSPLFWKFLNNLDNGDEEIVTPQPLPTPVNPTPPPVKPTVDPTV